MYSLITINIIVTLKMAMVRNFVRLLTLIHLLKYIRQCNMLAKRNLLHDHSKSTTFPNNIISIVTLFNSTRTEALIRRINPTIIQLYPNKEYQSFYSNNTAHQKNINDITFRHYFY